MPIIRNPFRKQDENVRPTLVTNGSNAKVNENANGKPIDVPKEKESAEYKLSGESPRRPLAPSSTID